MLDCIVFFEIVLISFFRHPELFSKITFLVDRFHNRNHCCDPIFSMKTYDTEEIRKTNSQICEQLFSALRRISTQIAYMRIDNVFFNTRYFLACWNKLKTVDFKFIS